MRRIIHVLFCFAVSMTACAAHYGHTLKEYPNAVEVSGKPFKKSWRVAERCSGLSYEFKRVRWYVIDDTSRWFWSVKGPAIGLAYIDKNVIVLSKPWIDTTGLIVHESLHLLDRRDFHNPELYQRRCADAVICWGSCLTDSIIPSR